MLVKYPLLIHDNELIKLAPLCAIKNLTSRHCSFEIKFDQKWAASVDFMIEETHAF